ncbi:MAG: lysophospholipid acyltransferase family protein [Nitrospinota bacterium]|nr:lysophospholipid acyltransferase family protein [Nitrospinota bacterium]MDP7385916.1 lysophospholipid acyltransferase family protein [Nitrospinota bacterium]HJM42122.1 lysophospholipid acyltransferase family protein [Nitrospinota bacterium]
MKEKGGIPERKRALETPAGRPGGLLLRCGGRIIGAALRVLAATCRAKVLFAERELPRAPGGPGRIYSLWHGRMLYPAYFHRKLRGSVLVSRSRDGEILTGALGALGHRTVRGSTSRGGTLALRRLIKTLRAGGDIGVASDGPRGPARRVQPGIIHLAARSGAPIVPIVFGAARAKTFASWDRFCLPCPFTRVALVFGRPLRVPPDADEALLEEKRRALEAEMDWTLEAADAAVQKRPLPPGPGGGPDSAPSGAPGGGP